MSLPVLGQEKWINNPEVKLSKLYEQAFVTDRSQSNLYHGEVMSVQAIIADTPNNIPQIAQSLSAAFNKYLSRYYDEVDVSVTEDESDSTQSTVAIDIVATQDGIRYSLGSTVSTADVSNIQRAITRLGSE